MENTISRRHFLGGVVATGMAPLGGADAAIPRPRGRAVTKRKTVKEIEKEDAINGRTFIYSAKAVGVGANFGGPNSLRQFWASRALPITGGIDPNRGEPGPSAHPVLNFRWAETELSGMEIDPATGLIAPGSGVHEIVVRVTVQGLKIMDSPANPGITADLVSVTVKWRCDLTTVDANRSVPAIAGANGTLDPFVNLRIAGNPVQLNLDSAFANNAAVNYAASRTALAARAKSITKNPRAGNPPFHTAFTHLVQLPNAQVAPSPAAQHEFGVIYNGNLPPGIAQIYLCEWFAAPDRQSLTIMRVRLDGANPGEIVICDPDPDSQDVP